VEDDIRQIIAKHGRITGDAGALSREEDLYEAGMTSHASVSVMLALEDRFKVDFPERMLDPAVFASIASISAALAELRAPARARGAV
jgi:acyl carrier protein